LLKNDAMKDFSVSLTLVSFLLLALGMLYLRTRRSLVTEPMIAMFAGIVVGPAMLNILDVTHWGTFNKTLEIASALAISMALISGAFRLPKNHLVHQAGVQSKLLLLGMVGMCIMSTLMIKFILGFSWFTSLLIGAIITPTDPVISATIASGSVAEQLVPARIRNAITFESSANDGLAFPFVMLPLLFIENKDQPLKEWFISAFLWQTIAAIIIGALIGFAAGKLFTKAKSVKSMAKPSMLVFSSALGFFVFGLLEIIDCNGIIGVFCAGFAAHQVLSDDENRSQSEEQEARERLFIIPIFFVFGLILPWQSWATMGWKIVVAAVLILLFRRLPVVLLIRQWMKKTFSVPDAVFIGWFGPIGAAAMFYAVYTYRHIHNKDVWDVVSAVVFLSTIVHGITGYPWSKWYHKKYVEQPEEKKHEEEAANQQQNKTLQHT